MKKKQAKQPAMGIVALKTVKRFRFDPKKQYGDVIFIKQEYFSRKSIAKGKELLTYRMKEIVPTRFRHCVKWIVTRPCPCGDRRCRSRNGSVAWKTTPSRTAKR